MFDDQLPNQSNTIPGNLPLAEPQDIFDSQSDSGQIPPAMPGVSGARVATPSSSAVGAGVLKPKAPESPVITTPPVIPGDDQTMYPTRGPVLSRGLMVILIILVIGGIVGGGGWWIYNSFIKIEQAEPFDNLPNIGTTNNAPVVGTVTETDTNVNDQTKTTTTLSQETVDNSLLFGEPIDTDGDQLEDSDESTYGTDPNNWDTDGDGLGDGEEVLIWKTDPLKADTDGDTFSDGTEVRSGYNPLGEGRLLQPPTTTK